MLLGIKKTYCVIVVPDIIGEIGFNAGLILLEYWSDHERWTPQELFIQRPRGRVFGVFVVQRSNDGGAGGVAVVEQRVKVRQEAIADHQRFSCSSGNAVPHCGILIGVFESIVAATERVKGPQFHPAFAELLGCFTDESANVSTVVRYSEHVELEHSCKYFQISSRQLSVEHNSYLIEW